MIIKNKNNCKHFANNNCILQIIVNVIKHHTCQNGLHIITESNPGVKTVALNWGVRAGVATNNRDGESVLLAELVQRGVRNLSAKEHSDALDLHGVNRHVSCGVEFIRITSVLLGNRLSDAISLLGAFFLHPTLPESDLPACKSLCLQSIQSLADNPSHIAAVELNKNHLPAPFNRSAYGTVENIKATTIEQLRQIYADVCVPNESIVVISGDVEHHWVVNEIEELVSSWSPGENTKIETSPATGGTHCIKQDTSQVHLSFAFNAPDATDENSLLEAVAISIFGGATSGRLFTQVRQRRSLCYSVSARYAPSKHYSAVRMNAGTTPERAEETVQVCLEQLSELKNGITKEEFDRTVQRMKSRIVMHGESTAARAMALWGDQYALGRTRSLAERLKELEGVRFEDVNAWLSQREFGEITFVYVGPEELNIDKNAFCV
ncbi:MAG: insulinase family protein [Planctomycetes bacterium]|nr:insulinase family protein [Planctomycetota bacterium]